MMRPLGPLLVLCLGACSSSHDRSDGGGDGMDASRRDAGGPVDGAVPRDSDTDAGASTWASCMVSPECQVVPASCCGSCGAATPTDMVGVNETRVSEQRAEACADGAACPGCFAMQDPFLIATCDTGVCRALDLHTHPATACTADDDCRLATAECCDCGMVGADRAIAISDGYALTQLTCDLARRDCPPCAPTFAPELFAHCDDTGHCAVGMTSP